MTIEEFHKKIDELNEQKSAFNAQIEQLNKELMDLEAQGITPGTKVSVKTRTRRGDEIETETFFFGVSIEWGEVRHVFHKVKKDGTMSQINQYIKGEIISIQKI